MSSKLRFRFIGLIGIMLLMVIYGAWLKDQDSNRLMVNTQSQMIDLLRSLKSVATTNLQVKQWLENITKHHPVWRITWINKDGGVKFDNAIDPGLLDNHLTRPEIVDALKSEYGTSIRESNSLHQQFLYTAVSLGSEGIVRLSISKIELTSEEQDFRAQLLAVLVVLLLIYFLLEKIAFQWTNRMPNTIRTIREWTNFNFLTRLDVIPTEPVAPLVVALNQMASSVHEQMRMRSVQFARLQTIVESMQTGIVLLDEQTKIVLMNDASEQFLGFSYKGANAKRFIVEVVPYEVVQWIDAAMLHRKTGEHELHVYYPEDRILFFRVIPLPMLPDGEAALMLLIQDITPLRRLERMRSEFVANVSHELKTPIAAIRGFAETLLSGAKDDPEISSSFLTIIMEESERLNRLINGILELSRLESKRVPMQYTRISLVETVQASMNVVRNEADLKKIALIDAIQESIYFEADEDRIRQVMINLLSNAVHYTLDSGKVTVQASIQQQADGLNTVNISVTDNGIGIHHDDLPRIFERFYRVDKARSRSSGGTGLGLSIVKHIIELHHGTIHVESRQGKGSRFVVILPLVQLQEKGDVLR